MSNIWKYASYGQRDRLKMIRSGNEDVYNTEKQRNKILKDLKNELGLSTKDIDDWDKTIDNAHSSGATSKASSARASLPRFESGVYSQVNSAFKQANEALQLEKQNALDEAEKEAEKALGNLSEWLANNGFSDKGHTSKKSKSELEESYKALIDAIKKEYKAKAEKTRSSYFSPYLR